MNIYTAYMYIVTAYCDIRFVVIVVVVLFFMLLFVVVVVVAAAISVKYIL